MNIENLLTLIALAITVWVFIDSSGNRDQEEKKNARRQMVWILILMLLMVSGIAVFFIFIKEDYSAFGDFSRYLKFSWFGLCLIWIFKKLFFDQTRKAG